MSFIFNVLIYSLFAWFMSLLARNSYTIYGDSAKMDKYIWYYILFFVCLVAFSWKTGTDGFGYTLRFIRGFKPDEGNTEYIYNYVTNFIASNGIPFFIGMGILAFGQIYPMVKVIHKYRFILIMLPFVMFGNCYFMNLMNAMRQMVVASMFVFASQYIVDKKLLKYAAVILIGSLIHHSALMLLPLYFIGYLMPWIGNRLDRRYLLLAIYVMCFVLGFTPAFNGIVSYAEAFSEAAGYESYTERVGEFLSGEYQAEVHRFGPMMMSYFLLGIFTIWFGPMLKKKYESVIPYFNIWYLFAFLYACLYFLIVNVSHIFIRPVLYFQLFQLIIVSLLLWELYQQPKNRLKAWFLVAVIWVEVVWNLYKNQGPTSIVNYHSMFFYDFIKYL